MEAAVSLDLFGDVSMVDTGARQDFDFYETPAWMTRSLYTFTPEIRGGSRVLECCSGRDAIANVLRRERGCQVFTNDIDTRHPAQQFLDASRRESWTPVLGLDGEHFPSVDWVVTNPPFNEAMAILRCAVLFAKVGVAFLLRKTFLEPTGTATKPGRGPWLQEHPPTHVIGLPRYAFRGAGSDSVSCDWMIWKREPDWSVQPPFVIDYIAESRVR